MNTCFYEMGINEEEDYSNLLQPPKEKMVLEVHHGDDKELEHQIIRVVSYPERLSLFDVTSHVIEYCHMYLTDDPVEIQKILHGLGL